MKYVAIMSFTASLGLMAMLAMPCTPHNRNDPFCRLRRGVVWTGWRYRFARYGKSKWAYIRNASPLGNASHSVVSRAALVI